MKRVIILAGIFGIIFVGLVTYSTLDDPELRYSVGKITGLKDMPTLTETNFIIEEVVVGIQSSTALTFIENDILFLEKETGKIRHIKNGVLVEKPLWDFDVKMEGCECYTESGLLGITSFNSDVYVYVTEEFVKDEKIVENRIYKF